jgi:hypothetical protein
MQGFDYDQVRIHGIVHHKHYIYLSLPMGATSNTSLRRTMRVAEPKLALRNGVAGGRGGNDVATIGWMGRRMIYGSSRENLQYSRGQSHVTMT